MESMDKVVKQIPVGDTAKPRVNYGIGLLGATSETLEGLDRARLDQIERHILRIERALFQANIHIPTDT